MRHPGFRRRASLLFVAMAFLFAVDAGAQQPRPATAELSDGWITTKIQASFFLDQDVKARNIDVRTDGGVVTLSGVISSERERDQAIAIARTVDGVKEVVDKLTMQPGAARPGRSGAQVPASDELERVVTSDTALLTQVKTKLALDPDVSALAIDVDVRDRVVTLRGTVRSEAERQQAIRIAREVHGVKDVRDALTVQR